MNKKNLSVLLLGVLLVSAIAGIATVRATSISPPTVQLFYADADQSTTSMTLVPSTYLQFSGAAFTTYVVTGVLYVSHPSIAYMSVGVSLPSGATYVMSNGVQVNHNNSPFNSVPCAFLTCSVSIVVHVGATPGTIAVSFESRDGNTATIQANSFINVEN